jgi:hypothetical protein
MFFWKKEKNETIEQTLPKTGVPFEEILKQAFRLGRFSPLQSQCSPAPDLVPVWNENNREILSPRVYNFFKTYEVPASRKIEVIEEIQKGYQAMINSGPNYDGGGSGAFLFSKKQVIDLSNEMFRLIALESGLPESEISSNKIFDREVFLMLSKQLVPQSSQH